MSGLSHIDSAGRARMVDVSTKPDSVRVAIAEAIVRVDAQIAHAIASGTAAKGEVLRTAELAGVMAAKRTSDLIPLCHPVPLDQIIVEASLERNKVRIRATARTTARTGVEMEAMTAAAVAALTIYDMVKGINKGIEIENVRLIGKRGGKSGEWRRDGP